MNRTIKFTILTALLSGTVLWVRAQNQQEAPAPTVVTIEVRYIEAPRAEVNTILPNTTYVVKEDVLKVLQEWVYKKKATILAQPRIATISGAQAQVRSVRELIYPTEYEPPTVTTTNATPQAATEKTTTFPTPSGFKTRELGVLFNVTHTVGPDGRWINITLIPELSQPSKLGIMKYETLSSVGKTEITQPDICSWNLTTSIVLKSGSTVLLAVHDPVNVEQYTAQENVVLSCWCS